MVVLFETKIKCQAENVCFPPHEGFSLLFRVRIPKDQEDSNVLVFKRGQ